MAYKFKTQLVSFLLVVPCLALLTGCGPEPSRHSDIHVTNGQEIQESDFPSTVLILGFIGQTPSICTATFVNDQQAITASHCVAGLRPNSPTLYYVRVEYDENDEPTYKAVAKASSFHSHSKYSMRDRKGINRYDLAIVNFPKNTAPAVSQIASETPEVGATLVIVGYGNNKNFLSKNGSLEGSGSGIKRFGVNRLSLVEDGMLVFAGLPESQEDVVRGAYASSGSGDSGGPMFIDNKLVGVTSGGGIIELEDGQLLSVSRYVDLTSDESKEFLDQYLLVD